MLSELWNFIKVSFKRRMFLYEVEVFSLTLFGSFPGLLVRFFCLGTFLIACTLLMPFLTSLLASQLKILFSKKYEADQKIKNEVGRIADRIGVRVKKVLIAKGLCNAYVRFGTLVLGEELLDRLGPSERRAVIAHELGHMKEKHVWFRIVATMTLPALPLWSWQRLYWPIIINEHVTQLMLSVMINIALLVYLIAVMIPLNWYLEARADSIAVEIAGKASTISALLALVNREEFELSSEDHPAISERVKLILKDKPRNGLIKRMLIAFSKLTKRFHWITSTLLLQQ